MQFQTDPVAIINEIKSREPAFPASGGTTNHTPEIERLRQRGEGDTLEAIAAAAAADLLEVHDTTGIVLDDWDAVRRFVEHMLGHPIVESEA